MVGLQKGVGESLTSVAAVLRTRAAGSEQLAFSLTTLYWRGLLTSGGRQPSYPTEISRTNSCPPGAC